MQTTDSDVAPLCDVKAENDPAIKSILESKSQKIILWICRHKLMLLCTTLIVMNIFSGYSIRKNLHHLSKPPSEKLRHGSFTDFKISLNDYSLIKSLCYGIFCSKHACYCSSKDSMDWFSAKSQCSTNFKNGSLAFENIEDILRYSSEEFLIHRHAYRYKSQPMWIGAYVNQFGKSLWMNNKTFENKIISIDHCVMKVGNHFERYNCKRYATALYKGTVINAHYCMSKHCREKYCYCLMDNGSPFDDISSFYFKASVIYFTSFDEVDFILQKFAGNYIIGASDIQEVGKWRWLGGNKGIDFNKVKNFIDKDVAKGCYISSNSKDNSIIYKSPKNRLQYLCQFPLLSTKTNGIPFSFLYREMDAPPCLNLNCNIDFDTCYCFSFERNYYVDCESYVDWKLLTIKNTTELKYVQSIMIDVNFKWRIGASNFIEKQRFQWNEEGGLNIPLTQGDRDYSCVALSKTAFHSISCQAYIPYICTHNMKQMIHHANIHAF